MSEGNRLTLDQAEQLAAKLVKLLEPVCERVEVAGSIRRKKPDIGDVEIVCIPKVLMTGLFGEKVYNVTAIYLVLNKHDYHPMKGGEKYIAAMKDGTQYDLFIATPDTWGCIFTIRTGSAAFTKRLVTQKAWGGLCPFEYYFSEGRIVNRKTGALMDTPEEDDVFRLLGIEFMPPESRLG